MRRATKREGDRFEDVSIVLVHVRSPTTITVGLYLYIPIFPSISSPSRNSPEGPITMFGFGGKSFNADTDIPDLSGKVILVTGGM